jgi:pyridoxal phosphate enzyme (YggS family)
LSPGSVGVRLAAVSAAVAAAAERAGRDPSAITIVAVTKTFGPEVVEAALAAGLRDIGENYVQEADAKRRAVGRPGTWHLIGGLQRNKVRAAVAVFDRVHTVDSVALASALADATARAGRCLPVLLQVNVGGDAAKRGVASEAVEPLAQAVLGHGSLRLDGLMTVPPADADARRWYKVLREVRDRAKQRLGVDLPHLSMGMSNDFTIAVEEGATLLRLGRALFGERSPGARRPGSAVQGDGT